MLNLSLRKFDYTHTNTHTLKAAFTLGLAVAHFALVSSLGQLWKLEVLHLVNSACLVSVVVTMCSGQLVELNEFFSAIMVHVGEGVGRHLQPSVPLTSSRLSGYVRVIRIVRREVTTSTEIRFG